MFKKVNEISDILNGLTNEINKNPIYIAGINEIYQFDFQDIEEVFNMQLKNRTAKISHGENKESDCTLILTTDYFIQLLQGDLSGVTAVMSGKIKVKGNIGKVIKMEKILRSYNYLDH